MQQTEKYQFNLIEGSDPFSPEPLNANMEKTEAALTAQAADTAAQFAALPKIHFQTYTGDAQPSHTHAFPFKPKLVVFIPAFATSASNQALVQGQEGGYRIGGFTGSPSFDVAWGENTVTLSGGTLYGMFNEKNHKYAILALG